MSLDMLKRSHPKTDRVVKVRLCNDHMMMQPPLATVAPPPYPPPPPPPAPRNSRNRFLANKMYESDQSWDKIAFNFKYFLSHLWYRVPPHSREQVEEVVPLSKKEFPARVTICSGDLKKDFIGGLGGSDLRTEVF